MKHRPEIDGLRALAVLPVIFFHAGFTLFSGGFLGVDVFFVISGYLITGIIVDDLTHKKFSIARFYARRARRILPALFAMMLICVLLAFAWMVPSQYEDFSRSLIAVVLFLSNIFYWRESGYFAAEASEKPLLHTWSLGVEEQFYVLFPLALLLAWRFGKQRLAFYGIVICALGSFAISEYASRYAFSANFFLLPTRAWELFAGSIVAFLQMRHPVAKHSLLSFVGLLLILCSMIAYNEQMRLPSAYSAIPVLGTALILRYGSHNSLAARILSWRPLVAIGLISYSAYLWHHPLFAFARIHMLNAPDMRLMFALAMASLLLGALSWKWIEQPFRQKHHPRYVGNRWALIMACVAAALLMAIGAFGYSTHGALDYWSRHATPSQVRAAQLMEEAQKPIGFYDNGDCIFHVNKLTQQVQERLVACQKKHGPGIAIIGDSHAINLFYVLKHHFNNRSFVAGISQGMCRPHSNLPSCYYDTLVDIIGRHPKLFRDVIYEQAGFHLLANAHGKEIDQGDISGLPLQVAVPDFMPNTIYIEAVLNYLNKIAAHSRVMWLTPRLEPEIRESVMIHRGCDYPFTLRPNQERVFRRLDEAIRARLVGTAIASASQMDMVQLNMQHDFMNCDKTYWKDRNHYSHAGEERFGNRITLDRLLAINSKPRSMHHE